MNKLDKISNTEELTSMLSALIKDPKGREYLKTNFNKIKKLYLSSNEELHFFGEAEETSIPNEPVKIKLKNFFLFISALEGLPEFKEEFEDYSYWARLYNEVQIPEYKRPDLKDIFSMSDLELRKINMLSDAKLLKDFVFSKILLSEDSISRQEKAIVLSHISDGKDYEFKSCGTSSLILKTGDKIVKLGLGRRKFEVPYHPRIMMPHFRKRYDDGSCLEVFDYGDTEVADITSEKVLEIYKELEDAGIIWGDASKHNLLILKKDNNLPDYIESEEFNVFGFLEDSIFPTNNHTPLKAGDIVVCDLDMLYAKDDPDCHYGDLDDIVETYVMMQEMRSKSKGESGKITDGNSSKDEDALR